MTHRNAHNSMVFFDWNRFSGFGYFGVEENTERAQ